MQTMIMKSTKQYQPGDHTLLSTGPGRKELVFCKVLRPATKDEFIAHVEAVGGVTLQRIGLDEQLGGVRFYAVQPDVSHLSTTQASQARPN